jgi:6-phosphogluconolactonase
MLPEVHRTASLDALSRIAAELICAAAAQSVESCGAFTLVLSGGNTPGPLYEILADPPLGCHMPWADIHLFWGDERWVPPNHPDSNFGMAAKNLLAHIDIPTANLHPIHTDRRTPEDAAKDYENELRNYFINAPSRKSGFDMVLLGMGTDGHTASLFPDSPAMNITDRLVAAVRAPDASPAVDRVTLTLPALNRANDVLFLISGREKMDLMQAILTKPEAKARLYPAARVRPRKRLLWLATPG